MEDVYEQTFTEQIADAIYQHSDRTGDSNVAGAFVYGNEWVRLS